MRTVQRRSRWALLGMSAVLVGLGPASARAVTISLVGVSTTGQSTTALAAGDTLSFEFVARNEERLDLYGVQLIAFGYDLDRDGLADDGLRMAGVQASASIFNEARSAEGEPSGGLEDLRAAAQYPAWAPNGGPALGLQTDLFAGVALAPSNGDGSLDSGLAGRAISEGDVHFRIAFQASAVPLSTRFDLHFGTGDVSGSLARGAGIVTRIGGNVVLLPVEDVVWSLDVLGGLPAHAPEPGTATLLGLGLVGLAARSRHERSL